MARPNSKIQKAKRAKRKIEKFSLKQEAELRYAESLNIDKISEKQKPRIIKSKYYHYVQGRDKSRPQTQIRDDITGDNTYVGSLIKKYWDYVNAGLIHHQNGLSKYEQAEFMEDNLSELEMKSAIEQADKWREATAKREEERRDAFRSFIKNVIPF